MKVDAKIDDESLAALGSEAAGLLCTGQIGALADRFGYALAYGRDPAAAILADVRFGLGEVGTPTKAYTFTAEPATVKYLEPNTSGLFAVVECLVVAADGRKLMLELIVAGDPATRHVSLEQISAA